MKPLPLATWDRVLAQARLLGSRSAWGRVTKLAVDSRRTEPGCVFVALPGENTDGHRYILPALENGACAILAKIDRRNRVDEAFQKFPDAGFALVSEPLDLMAEIARAHLDRLEGLYRVGVTGSNGKTTTKEMFGSVFSRVASTWVSEGNLNSEIGLPMTSLEVNEGHRWGVFEMGINHQGEMDRLHRSVFPDLAVVTNVGSAHIGILGSREAIALEKKKIFSLRGKDATAVLPAECDLLPALVKDFDGRVVLFGENDPDYRFLEDRGLDGSVFSWERRRIHLQLPGKAHVRNALAVAKACQVLGIGLDALGDGLETVRASFGRAQVVRGRVDLVLDCYNANFDSMKALLDALPGFSSRGRKILVLGSMKELGDQSPVLHEALGVRAAGTDADKIFWFGDETMISHRAVQATGFSGETAWTNELEILRRWLEETVREGDLVVLKGSRSTALERLAGLWSEENKEEKPSHVL